MGNWALVIGHWAWKIGELGMGNWALELSARALALKSALSMRISPMSFKLTKSKLRAALPNPATRPCKLKAKKLYSFY